MLRECGLPVPKRRGEKRRAKKEESNEREVKIEDSEKERRAR